MSNGQQPVTREDLDRVADRLSAQLSDRLSDTEARMSAQLSDRLSGTEAKMSAQLSDRLSDAEAKISAQFTKRLDAAVEALTTNLSDLREELRRRLDRVETNLNAMQMQTFGMSKSLTDAERLDGRMLDAQFAQQRAIDDLAKRVADLERRINLPDRQ